MAKPNDAQIEPKKAAPVKRARRRPYETPTKEEEDAVKQAIEGNQPRKNATVGRSAPSMTEPVTPVEGPAEKVSTGSDRAEREREAWRIVKGYLYKVSAFAAIPIPIVDLAGVVLNQSEMLRELSEVYETDSEKDGPNEAAGKVWGGYNAITTGAMVLGSAMKMIPVLGSALGIGSVGLSAAASTYNLGKSIIAKRR